MQEIRFPLYARVAFMLLILVLVIYLLEVGKGIFVPLLFSLLIAFLLYPVCKKLEKKAGMGTYMAAFLAISGFVVLIAVLAYLTTIQILRFSQDIPLIQQKVTSWIDGAQDYIIREYQVNSNQQLEYLRQMTNSMTSYATNYLGALFIGVTEFVFWMVLVFIYTYFILTHRRLLLHFIMRLFRREFRMKVRSIVMETRQVTNYYLQGLFIEFVVVTVANSLGLYLLGVRYALLLGVITALLNIIPYLGIIIGCVITAFITLAHGTPALAFQAIAVLFFLHVLDANILLPRVIGMKMKMNTLSTIIAVLVGSVLWGLSGMFLAIPLGAMLKIIFDHVESLEPWGMVMGEVDKGEDA